MSNAQKNGEEGLNAGNVLSDADTIDKIEWNDFWENRDFERDLQEAYKDMREAYQSFN